MSTEDKIMVALEAAAASSEREGRWSTMFEVNAFRDEAGLSPNRHIYLRDLDTLVDLGRAERKSDVAPHLYRPVYGGGGSEGVYRSRGGDEQPDGKPRGEQSGGETFVPPIAGAVDGTVQGVIRDVL